MNFDFQAIMLIALLITGGIWAADHWYFAPRRNAVGIDDVKEPSIVEYSRSFFPIILIVLILRSFLVEPFRIPSGSMMPTLQNGDFILVNKFSYGVRLPLLGTKILDMGSPQRGDVVVFRYPSDPSIDYIKRVIGLPGDTITYQGKQLTINGEPVKLEHQGIYTGMGSGLSMNGADLYSEMLDQVEHQVLGVRSRRTGEGSFSIPEGQYFVMGDNRDNSNDSRFWGTVPEANLVGRAFMIWMNWDSVEGVMWERIGDKIK